MGSYQVAEPTFTSTATNATEGPAQASANSQIPPLTPCQKGFCALFWIAIGAFFLFYIFHIPPSLTIEVGVDSISVSPFQLSASHITANWNITFSIINPNEKTDIFYDLIGSSIFYKKVFLASTNIVSFNQGSSNVTLVQAILVASSVHVDNWVENAIATDKSGKGVVEFNLKLQAMVRFDPGKKHELKKTVIASCDPVEIKFSPNSVTEGLVGGSRKCDVVLRILR